MLVVVRTPPDVSLYHRHGNPLFANVLQRLGSDAATSRRSCSPERQSSAPICCGSPCPRSVVPEHAVDAQSLVARADLVVSAGGTMNREAAALGVPVYTTFAGGSAPSTSASIASGRLRRLVLPTTCGSSKRPAAVRASPRPGRCSSTSCFTALEDRG